MATQPDTQPTTQPDASWPWTPPYLRWCYVKLSDDTAIRLDEARRRHIVQWLAYDGDNVDDQIWTHVVQLLTYMSDAETTVAEAADMLRSDAEAFGIGGYVRLKYSTPEESIRADLDAMDPDERQHWLEVTTAGTAKVEIRGDDADLWAMRLAKTGADQNETAPSAKPRLCRDCGYPLPNAHDRAVHGNCTDEK
jgi:hypothetical protein